MRNTSPLDYNRDCQQHSVSENWSSFPSCFSVVSYVNFLLQGSVLAERSESHTSLKNFLHINKFVQALQNYHILDLLLGVTSLIELNVFSVGR